MCACCAKATDRVTAAGCATDAEDEEAGLLETELLLLLLLLLAFLLGAAAFICTFTKRDVSASEKEYFVIAIQTVVQHLAVVYQIVHPEPRL